LILLLSNDLLGYNQNNTNITFIHIPKNAGSSIEYIGYNNGYTWGKYYFYDFYISYLLDKIVIYYKINYHSFLFNYFFKILRKSFQSVHHLPESYKNNKRLIENKVSFLVIRNPYNKILSNYNFLNYDNDEINVFIKKNIIDLKNNIKRKNVYHFFIPQHEYLLHNTEILRFENIDNDFKNFCKKHNLKDMTLPKHNISNNKKKININHLNKESLNLINQFYIRDFELFNYEKINAN